MRFKTRVITFLFLLALLAGTTGVVQPAAASVTPTRNIGIQATHNCWESTYIDHYGSSVTTRGQMYCDNWNYKFLQACHVQDDYLVTCNAVDGYDKWYEVYAISSGCWLTGIARYHYVWVRAYENGHYRNLYEAEGWLFKSCLSW